MVSAAQINAGSQCQIGSCQGGMLSLHKDDDCCWLESELSHWLSRRQKAVSLRLLAWCKQQARCSKPYDSMRGSRLKSAEQSLCFESCAAAEAEPGSDADEEDLEATGQACPIQR